MSASDAAPLPRLGEIFFDVRGSSRSMRLSWYSNTGIAVFSIWQGGTCTGTFRLPIDDLSRLLDSLRRGMPGQADESAGQAALGAQRPRLAIGAGSAAEPFTGMFSALPDDRAAAQGMLASNGRRTGGFAALSAPAARGDAEAGSGVQGRGTGEQYAATQQYGTPPPDAAQLYGTAQQYLATQQYGSQESQYSGADQYGQYEAADRPVRGARVVG